MSGVDLQSKVKELQLPIFNPSISQSDSSCKEAVEMLRGDAERGSENLVPTLGSAPFILGQSLPVVPVKLVKRIIKGDYLDMAEMLSDNMEVERRRALAESEGGPSSKSTGRREVPDMLSWLHCFSLYAAIVCSHRPDRARQMWTYQTLMITEARRCGGRGWLLYDATFRQQAASRDNADFSRLNQSLYATTFLAYGNRKQSCPNCMLSDHTVQECALYIPRPSPAAGMHISYQEKHSRNFDERPTRGEVKRKRFKRGPCYAWNVGMCMAQQCQWEHVCSKCAGDHRRPMCSLGPSSTEVKQEERRQV